MEAQYYKFLQTASKSGPEPVDRAFFKKMHAIRHIRPRTKAFVGNLQKIDTFADKFGPSVAEETCPVEMEPCSGGFTNDNIECRMFVFDH